jgi:hypothetical protein
VAGRDGIVAFMRARFVVLFIAITSGTVAGQWLNHPTPGIPRSADGTFDANAPPPRAPDGRPDFSGLWTGAMTMPDTCAGPGCIQQEPLPIQAIHIGFTSPDQPARVRSGALDVFTLLPYQPWAAELARRRQAFQQGNAASENGALVDQHARCLPPNYPRAWAFPQYRRILQTADRLVILHEFNASYRQVFTDARPLPPDPNPAWNGYSSGRWDGETLVVTSVGFRDDLWLDMTGSPMTGAARVTERIRRPRFGRLEIDVTVDDPKAYTKPWTTRLDQSFVADTELLDNNCVENEQSVRHMIGK